MIQISCRRHCLYPPFFDNVNIYYHGDDYFKSLSDTYTGFCRMDQKTGEIRMNKLKDVFEFLKPRETQTRKSY
jgi:hypothetical protein